MKQIYFYAILLLSGIANSQTTHITLVKDINPGTKPSSPTSLFAFNGKLYFAADDSSGSNTGETDVGNELWVSDGTETETKLVKDLDGTDADSNPGNFFILNNALYFQAYDAGTASYNMYTTDGTEDGTNSFNNNFQAGIPTIVGDKAYMRSYVWNADFTDLTGTYYEFNGETFKELPDSGEGSVNVGYNAGYIALDDNSILFNTEYTIAGETPLGPELYLYNITDQTYTLIKNFGDDGTVVDGELEYLSMSYLTKLGDAVYFSFDGKLWITDGTTDGTMQVSTTAAIGDVRDLYVWEDKLFFEGDLEPENDTTVFDQLYVYDPDADSLTDITGPYNIERDHNPMHFAAPGDGYLYYAGRSSSDLHNLFKTDGVTIETVESGLIDNVDDIVVLNNKLYFEADFKIDFFSIGRELFSVDPSSILSASEFELDSSLSIYPNPSTNYFNVQSTLEGEINYTIYNVTGKKVLKGTIENEVINHNLTSGLYLLKLDNGFNSISKKIVVKN
ncbi:T9SS type A sorting domain-containing protein [Flavivirga jejuensis]|uniref:T9SS type A sorting domain-containing protein n=1 Tax=Flavivirga jejuensis TaxID=870487 RepID=A0ABT8WKV3_9FLAO|nr:T9SS type A sorting domain-containing protein [Flavivirga jejuensis]MDO5973787.1 T9SS type A sorting domain-containing protein [Flavivirga jejuensis]